MAISLKHLAANGKFKTIVADPPWRYTDKVNMATLNDKKAKGRRGAEGHYPTMAVEDIMAMPLGEVASATSHLWLWVTNTLMEEGYAVCRAWGFVPKTLMTWAKGRLEDNRLVLQIGMGRYLRNVTEHVIFGVREHEGTRKLAVKNRSVPTFMLACKGKHSKKPERFFHTVEKTSPGPYLELFSRRHREGWTTWGNDIKQTRLLK